MRTLFLVPRLAVPRLAVPRLAVPWLTELLLVVLLLTVLVGALPAWAQSPPTPPLASSPREVVIGVVYPLSGPVGQLGRDAVEALRMGVEIINNNVPLNLPLAPGAGLPGLGGARVRIEVVDHQGQRGVGEAATWRLGRERHVHALLGAFYSSVTDRMSQVAEQLGIPMVNEGAGAPNLTNRGLRWFFRTGPHDGEFSRLMFEFLRDFQRRKGLNIGSMAMVYEDTPWGLDSARGQVALAQRGNYRVLKSLVYPPRTDSFEDIVSILRTAAPDVLLPSSGLPEAVLFMQTAKARDYQPRMLIAQNGGYASSSFLRVLGRDAEGVITRARFNPDLIQRIPLLTLLNSRVKRRSGGRDLSDLPVRALVAFFTLVAAIDRAGSTEPEKIRAALAGTDIPPAQIPLPWGGIRFAPNGHNLLARGILVQMRNGQYCTIYPFEVASCAVRYPMPPWEKAGKSKSPAEKRR